MKTKVGKIILTLILITSATFVFAKVALAADPPANTTTFSNEVLGQEDYKKANPDPYFTDMNAAEAACNLFSRKVARVTAQRFKGVFGFNSTPSGNRYQCRVAPYDFHDTFLPS